MPGFMPGIHVFVALAAEDVDGRNKPGHDGVGKRQLGDARRLFRNARLIDPESGLDAPGDLLIDGDRIAAIGPGLAEGGFADDVEIVDSRGLCLAPGLVDMRVQLREPGAEHMESIQSAGQAAAAGGVTTMVALPNTEPPVDNVSVVEFLARRAREVRLAKLHTYAAATKGMAGRELTEMGLLAANGALGFTDGVKAVADALVMRRVLAYARSFDQLVIQHPEEPSLGGAGEVTEGEIATRLGLAAITPMAEVIMIERDLRLVEITGARFHIAHVSTEAGIEAIRRAKTAGLQVTCDTAPPYFALNETAIGDYRTFAKLSPPLRSEADRRAVVAGLADGTIDAIASDHAPWDQDSKRLPFSSASCGIVGLETLLPLSLELYHNHHLELIEVLRRLTINPARILGLGVGRLVPRSPADLVLFDPDIPWQIDTDRFRSKSKNAPFDGRPVQGRAEQTIVDGRTIFVRER